MLSKIMTGIGAIGLALAVQASSAVAQDATSVLEQIKQRGSLMVGVVPTLPPSAMRAKDGTLIGFEIDVATRLAEEMGVKVEFVPVVWDGLIPGLLASKFDVIITSMTMTPARNLTINFSDSYSGGGMYLAGNKELNKGKTTLADFNKPDITIATMRGSTTSVVAKQFMPNAVNRQFDDEALMIQEVINGRANAFLASAPRPQYEILANPNTLELVLPDPIVRSAEGMGVRKGDPDFLNFLNNWIFLRLRDDWIQTRHRFWFDNRDWADLVETK